MEQGGLIYLYCKCAYIVRDMGGKPQDMFLVNDWSHVPQRKRQTRFNYGVLIFNNWNITYYMFKTVPFSVVSQRSNQMVSPMVLWSHRESKLRSMKYPLLLSYLPNCVVMLSFNILPLSQSTCRFRMLKPSTRRVLSLLRPLGQSAKILWFGYSSSSLP